jgi:hypothetical protein
MGNTYEISFRMIKSRKMRWTGHVARMGRRGMHVGYWWGSQKEGRTPGIPRRRWIDTIKIDLKRGRMGWYGLDRSGSG